MWTIQETIAAFVVLDNHSYSFLFQLLLALWSNWLKLHGWAGLWISCVLRHGTLQSQSLFPAKGNRQISDKVIPVMRIKADPTQRN